MRASRRFERGKRGSEAAAAEGTAGAAVKRGSVGLRTAVPRLHGCRPKATACSPRLRLPNTKLRFPRTAALRLPSALRCARNAPSSLSPANKRADFLLFDFQRLCLETVAKIEKNIKDSVRLYAGWVSYVLEQGWPLRSACLSVGVYLSMRYNGAKDPFLVRAVNGALHWAKY